MVGGEGVIWFVATIDMQLIVCLGGIKLNLVTSCDFITLRIMADRSKYNKNILIIDLNVWTTQAKKADESGIKLTTISQQIVRTKKGQTPHPVEYWDIPELGITLVKK